LKSAIREQHTGKQSGFTVLELLIVLTITITLAASVAPLYGNLQVSSQLNEESAQLLQAMRVARARAVARLNNSGHGVRLDTTTNSYTLYQGASYALRDATYDRKITLPSAITLATSLSGAEVNFSKGLGVPTTTGTTTLTHTVYGTREIVITDFGMAEEN
jgi:prepilin-type N-terminal cleavage/methylation domain-containing protein